uniref:Amino acid transporter transmembrane domain-containing protein n=1 Tax=Amphora coffeiformis TaxID=265554 RepID=A0A7S3KVF1_9STRA|mmetsp:Transcript_9941/g.19088  ORF Transcript_9941/g.19088 Transcript_9941/m.19088 type:complete len:647 (-) Transcript_9941:54-1994(-)
MSPSYGAMNADTSSDKKVPLLSSPTSGTTAAKPFNVSYQSTQGMPTYLVESVPPEVPLSEVGSVASNGSEEHQTTVAQTFIHLVKGYIGVGLLSLPWAISQLGITVGFCAVFLMSFWSSYNCWTVVRVKRYIEHQRHQVEDDNMIDKVSDTGSVASTNTNITYPELGEWAYGRTFQSYVRACICTQQMAICTVFISFIGENLNALLREAPVDFGFWETHTGVMTMALPFCLSLSFIPTLKRLAPIMAVGSILVIGTLLLLGIVGGKEWSVRPDAQELPSFDLPSAPLAMCAILYSYEGICLILPIESAMKEPKHFGPTFAGAMFLVALIMAVFGSFCVYAFGNVTNGSITAFLIHHYQSDASLRWWLLMANTTISLSVLLTYPLQLFPAVELIGPWWSNYFGGGDLDLEEKDMNGFDPMPALPEHGEYAHEEEEGESNTERTHKYGDERGEFENDQPAASSLTGLLKRAGSSIGIDTDDAASVVSSVMDFPNQMMPKMILPGDSPQLRATLVLLTYTIAVVVPNVQALISLAGALAGSSSALLIPPVLELAWLEHLAGGSKIPSTTKANTAVPDRMAATSPPSSPVLNRMPSSFKPVKQPSFLRISKAKCYVLFVAGFMFMLIGTYDSLANIIAIYSGHDTDGDEN